MELGVLEIYLIVINIIGFLAFTLNYWTDIEIDSWITNIAVMGGSLGIVIAIACFHRRFEKYVMMSRVFVACLLVIQVILYLIIKGHIQTDITLRFWEFFNDHPIFKWYLIVINFVSLVVYGIDKLAAVEHTWRIRIVTLLVLAFVGGSVGAIAAMYLFRHKIRVDYFTIGVPLIMIMQVVVLFYLMNGAL